jgi:DNA-binding IclR family transcriptional regulator
MNEDSILELLKKTGTPMKLAEIADASGIDKKEVDKAIKSLKAKDKIFSPKNCYYQAK